MFGKKKVPAKAVIIADEGYHMTEQTGSYSLQHEKYIVEVHPDGEAAFRTEVKAWVSWIEMPEVGDEVVVMHEPGSQKVELVIHGDPRYDWKARAEAKKQNDAAARERLLKMPPETDGPATPPT